MSTLGMQLPKIKLTTTRIPVSSTLSKLSPSQSQSSLVTNAQLIMTNSGDWKPYREKVKQQLKQTQLNSDLIEILEMKLYAKTQVEIEKLRCERNFDMAKKYYMSTCRHLISNLKSDNSIGNLKFIEMVNAGQLSIEEVINLSPQEMHEDRWKSYIEKKDHDIMQQLKGPEATTDMFFCGRCKKTQCKYYESQDRSADEPMTVHITCCNCGNKWRQ